MHKYVTTTVALLWIFGLTGIAGNSYAGDQGPSKYEFRGVWVATVVNDWSGTGWPPPEDRMHNILNRAERLGLNSIVLQVVGRGDAIYPSERLPWSRVMTGTAGEDPGYDPLQMWIDATHERGMEFHAWFNVFMIAYGNVNDSDNEDLLHVRFSNPEWIENNTWLNPGIPEAREWHVGNVMELVENYDIDAIHFDYIRYDNGGFSNDSETMAEHNPDNISGLANWRRHNVNEFVREVYEGIQDVKPWVKIGSAPVGHYDSGSTDGWAAFYGYSSAFQDSRHWAEQGHMDYIAPQVYWTIGEPPRFEYIVSDWVQNRKNDRHLYIGTNPADGDVRSEIHRQIDTTRVRGAEGQLYFRYSSISDRWDIFSGRYDTRAIVPPMEWRIMSQPNPVRDLVVTSQGNEVHLSWDKPDTRDEDSRFRYVIYRVDGSDLSPAPGILANPANIIKTTGLTSYTDVFEEVTDAREYRYFVTSLSRNNVESDAEEQAIVVSATEDSPPVAGDFRLHQNFPNPFNPETEISFRIPESGQTTLAVYDMLGRRVITLVDETLSPGSHQYRIHAGNLASGVYLYRLQSGDFVQSRKMILSK